MCPDPLRRTTFRKGQSGPLQVLRSICVKLIGQPLLTIEKSSHSHAGHRLAPDCINICSVNIPYVHILLRILSGSRHIDQSTTFFYCCSCKWLFCTYLRQSNSTSFSLLRSITSPIVSANLCGEWGVRGGSRKTSPSRMWISLKRPRSRTLSTISPFSW